MLAGQSFREIFEIKVNVNSVNFIVKGFAAMGGSIISDGCASAFRVRAERAMGPEKFVYIGCPFC